MGTGGHAPRFLANREGLRSVWYPMAAERTPDPRPVPDYTLDSVAQHPTVL